MSDRQRITRSDLSVLKYYIARCLNDPANANGPSMRNSTLPSVRPRASLRLIYGCPGQSRLARNDKCIALKGDLLDT